MKKICLLAVPVLLAGCSAAESIGLTAKNPIKEANLLSAGAEKCLLDVRDHGLTYEKSPNCNALGVLSKAYIDAGGQLPDEPTESKLVGEQAVRMAWAARAISASGDPTISLW